ncbi:MAG: MFS transporter [Blastocatellia bacterium]
MRWRLARKCTVVASAGVGVYWLLRCFSALGSLQRPAREALLPRLLPPEQMGAAAALGSLRYTIAAIAGPALGGVLAASAGAGIAYAIDCATFLVSLLCLLLMRAVPPPKNADQVSWQSIANGLRYAWRRRELLGTYLIDMNAMFWDADGIVSRDGRRLWQRRGRFVLCDACGRRVLRLVAFAVDEKSIGTGWR